MRKPQAIECYTDLSTWNVNTLSGNELFKKQEMVDKYQIMYRQLQSDGKGLSDWAFQY